jgi:hypothetical protein
MKPHELREALSHVRSSVVALHRSLLNVERADYERIHGRIDSPGELLRLATDDPSFQWLRIVSEWIVMVDELLDDSEALTWDKSLEVVLAIHTLFSLAGNPEAFQKRYRGILERDADVSFEHTKLMALIKPWMSKAPRD